MSPWRIGVVLGLFALPVLFLGSVGGYYLWERHWSFWAWWPMVGCWALAYGLAWRWQRQRRLLAGPELEPPLFWTDQDLQAWKLVEARAKQADQIPPDRLDDPQFYFETARDMALELARAYHPDVADPVSELTVPELLAVVELAAHDLAELVEKYLPGGHLLTVRRWRQAKQAVDWYQTANKIYWLVTALFAPVQTGLRYAASQLGVSRPWQALQQNLLVWFYTAFVHRVGNYLVELHGGRLAVGATRYRELLRRHAGAPAEPAAEPAVPQVTLTVTGQVKAGKSSFINALLGAQRARTDVLPATDAITRYDCHPDGIPTRLVLLDTVGYGHAGPKEDQVQATRQAAQESDLVVLVLHARNPARQADLELLKRLADWFAAHPALKKPPLLAVLTHVDLLTPATEWAPPYDWQNPTRPKEQHVQAAVATVREQLGTYLAGCIPVCTQAGKVYGIDEWFLPALAELLDEAHAVGLLRCLRAEADAGKIRRLFRQLTAAGAEGLKLVWQAYTGPT